MDEKWQCELESKFAKLLKVEESDLKIKRVVKKSSEVIKRMIWRSIPVVLVTEVCYLELDPSLCVIVDVDATSAPEGPLTCIDPLFITQTTSGKDRVEQLYVRKALLARKC